LHEAPRHWVYHPKIDFAVAEMKNAADKKQQAATESFEKRVAEFSAAYLAGVKELESRVTPTFDKNDELLKAGIGDHLGIVVDGAGCFTVGNKELQFSIIKHAFVPSDDAPRGYRVKALFNWFKERGLIRPPFRYVEPKLEQALQDKGIGFLTPYRAIETYLDALVDRGVLKKAQSYYLASSVMSEIGAIRAADALRESRREDICNRVGTILAALPNAERESVCASDWLTILQECGISFADAIERDDSRFEQMDEALRTIEAMMFRKGAPGSDTLELPIAAERARQGRLRQAEAEERETARVEKLRKASEARLERLVRASASLDPDGDAWIEAPHPRLGGRKPVDMARAGDDELMEALGELHIEARARKAKREREQFILDLQSELENEVEQILGEATRPFLGSPYPELGRKKPRDYCVCRNTLKECLDLAEKVRRGHR
jgi:hypothetical protein